MYSSHGLYTTNGFSLQQAAQHHEGGCSWVLRPRPLRTTMTAPQDLRFQHTMHFVTLLVGNSRASHVGIQLASFKNTSRSLRQCGQGIVTSNVLVTAGVSSVGLIEGSHAPPKGELEH